MLRCERGVCVDALGEVSSVKCPSFLPSGGREMPQKVDFKGFEQTLARLPVLRLGPARGVIREGQGSAGPGVLGGPKGVAVDLRHKWKWQIDGFCHSSGLANSRLVWL